MIPYTGFTAVSIGPITLQVWGLLVAVGLLISLLVGRRLVRSRGLSEEIFFDLAFKLLFGGFLGARLVHVALYHWSAYQEDPLSILYIWQGGFSSIGGIAGALAVILFYRKKIRQWGAYVSVLSFSAPLGWFFGRVGCFLIHDHPGVCTDFALGMNNPSGCTRHDLGLYEALLMMFISAIFFGVYKRYGKKADKLYAPLLMLLYGLPRFFLDFLRIGDRQYLSLTPAQWGSIIMAIVGVSILLKQRGRREKISVSR